MSDKLKIYETLSQDFEFIGFSFNGKHSSEFGLTAVIPSGRYEENLFSSFDDRTAEVAGKDGAYYFGTDIKTRPINISLAFDNLTGRNRAEVLEWLNPKIVGKLIFDSLPYKYYFVKVSQPPQFSYIPFEGVDGSEKTYIYKGTIDLQLMAYDPYSYSDFQEVDQVLVWTGSEYETVYSELNLPSWYGESGLFDSLPINTATANSSTGETIVLASPGIIPVNFYNGGTVSAPVSLTFTIDAFNIGATPLIIKNTDTGIEFTVHSLKNIKGLEDHAGPWTIVCEPKKGMIYTTINSIKYNLGAIHKNFLYVVPGDNEFTTNMALTNLNVKYKYIYW